MKLKFEEEEGEKKLDPDKLNESEIELKKVCEWFLKYPEPNEEEDEEETEKNDNILKALLNQMSDRLALQYMGYYS